MDISSSVLAQVCADLRGLAAAMPPLYELSESAGTETTGEAIALCI